MKLRNKKTGEIVGLSIYGIEVHIRKEEQPFYHSLAKLNEEWEDYKQQEPLIEDEKSKNSEFRYSVEVWVYHRIVDSYKCASLNEAREWLRKEGWIKSWAYGDCCFDVFKDGKEVSFDILHENKFYDEEE